MIPNHHQLLGLFEAAEPAFLAARFATDFPAYPDREGERGTVLFFDGGYWDVRMDGGPAFLHAPGGSRMIQTDGSAEDGPAMENLPMRPPWSLVLPRWSAFLGRLGDDWQINAGEPVEETDGAWRVPLTNLEKPEFTGTLTVDAERHVITRVELGHMIQSLTIGRTEPTGDDLAALQTIKSSVQQFTGAPPSRSGKPCSP